MSFKNDRISYLFQEHNVVNCSMQLVLHRKNSLDELSLCPWYLGRVDLASAH